MTLLIYLLFLIVAAVVLFMFPYNQSTQMLTLDFATEAAVYLSWLAVDIGVVWLFAIAALHWPIWKYYRSLHRHTLDQKTLMELMLPHHNIAYFTTSTKAKESRKWWFLVFLCLLPSFPFSYFAVTISFH